MLVHPDQEIQMHAHFGHAGALHVCIIVVGDVFDECMANHQNEVNN